MKLSVDCNFVHFANLFKTTDVTNFHDPDSFCFCFSYILGPVQMSIFSCTKLYYTYLGQPKWYKFDSWLWHPP